MTLINVSTAHSRSGSGVTATEGQTKNLEEPPYLEYNLRLIHLIGIWREKGPFGLPFLRLSPYCIYIFGIYCIVLTGSVLQLLQSYNNLEIITETLCALFSFAVNCHKLLIMVAYKRRFKRLLYLIKHNFESPRQRANPRHHALLVQRDRENKLLTYIFGVFVVTTATFINVFPMAEWYFYQEPFPELAANGTSSYEWRFPYRLVLPFDTTSSPVTYWLVYAYHCSIGWCHILVMPGTDNFYIALLNHVYGQCQLLRQDMERLRADALAMLGSEPGQGQGTAKGLAKGLGQGLGQGLAEDAGLQSELGPAIGAWRAHYKQLLNEAVQHHKTIIEYVETLEFLLNKPMLTQFFTSSICLCTTVFQILVFPTETVKLMGMTTFCVGVIVQLWMYCYFANKITAETDAVGDSAYSSEWYEADAACKRSLGIVITRAQKRTPFTVGKFTELSLDTFASILKGSYTYLMLLIEARG